MEYSGALSGGTAPLVATFKAGETLTAGRVVNSETTAGTGQLEAATATGFVDCMGTVMAVGGGGYKILYYTCKTASKGVIYHNQRLKSYLLPL